ILAPDGRPYTIRASRDSRFNLCPSPSSFRPMNCSFVVQPLIQISKHTRRKPCTSQPSGKAQRPIRRGLLFTTCEACQQVFRARGEFWIVFHFLIVFIELECVVVCV